MDLTLIQNNEKKCKQITVPKMPSILQKFIAETQQNFKISKIVDLSLKIVMFLK